MCVCVCMDVQLFQHHLLKRLPFFHCFAFALLSKISWLYLCEFISVNSVLLCWSTCVFFHLYYAVWITATLLQILRLCRISPSILLFSFNIVLAILGLLSLHTNFRISLSISIKEVATIDQAGKNWHLNSIVFLFRKMSLFPLI